MKIQLKRFTAMLLLFVFLCTAFVTAQDITYKEPKRKAPRIKQKTKLFVGFNYENYRTSFFSKTKQTSFEDLSTPLNEGLTRLHLNLTTPINIGNFKLDVLIPFGTHEQLLDSMIIDNTMNTFHKKFNVFEFDVGIEFEF